MLAKDMPVADRTALWNSYGTYPVAAKAPEGWTPTQEAVDNYYVQATHPYPTYIAANPLAVKAQDDNSKSSTGVSATAAQNAMRTTLASQSAFGAVTDSGNVNGVGTGAQPIPLYIIVIAAIVALWLLVRR